MAFSTSAVRDFSLLFPLSSSNPTKKNAMQITPLVMSGLLGIKDAAIRLRTVPSSIHVGR